MSRPDSVAVAWMSSGLLRPRRSPASARAAASAPGEAGFEQRAVFDLDDVMRAGAHEPDFVVAPVLKAGVERRAAAAGAVGVDQRRDFRLDAGALQRGDEQVALPLGIERRAPYAASRSRRIG